MNDIKPLNPGQTMNVFGHKPDALTQIQHKFNRVEIVTHLDKGPSPIDAHVVTRVDRRGGIHTDY